MEVDLREARHLHVGMAEGPADQARQLVHVGVDRRGLARVDPEGPGLELAERHDEIAHAVLELVVRV
jgi:hypothetical protein